MLICGTGLESGTGGGCSNWASRASRAGDGRRNVRTARIVRADIAQIASVMHGMALGTIRMLEEVRM